MCSGGRACSQVSFAAGQAAQKDLRACRREYLFKPPQLLKRLILPALADERDIPVAFLLANILQLTLPSALIVFSAPKSHLVGAIYLMANFGLLFPRFVVSLLHVTEHRRLFKPGEM